MSALHQYWQAVDQQLAAVKSQEQAHINTAAQWIAEAFIAGKFIYVFGSGHSHTLAEEAFYRASGFVRVVPIFDENLMVHKGAIASTEWERKEGYATQVLSRYALGAGDVLLVVSSSGRNAVPVEMAIEGKKRGAKVLGLTSIDYSSALVSRHSSGKKLMDVADLVIDNHSVMGDGVVELNGLPTKVAPTSTITCAFIWNSIVAATVEELLRRGAQPEVWASANSAAEILNAKHQNNYRGRIRHL
jgi:uncharacterized phosphosugar-binding protein